MKRFAIAVTFATLIGSLSFAQESAKTESENREVEREEQPSAGRERRRYSQKEMTVKDPAGFKVDGEAVFSGPQPGEKVPAFTAASLVGEDRNKEIDPIAAAGDQPQVLFFQDESGVAIRGLFGIVKAISKINQVADKKLHVTCVFLADDPDSITSRFGQLFPRLREEGIDVVAASKDGRDGPGAYGLNRTVAQTIILSRNSKVTRNFVFRQGMLYPDPHVLGAIAELVDEDRDTVAGWLAETGEETDRMRMRGRVRDDDGNDPQAEAKAMLREKVGKLMRAGKLTREEAAELYEAAFPKEKRLQNRN